MTTHSGIVVPQLQDSHRALRIRVLPPLILAIFLLQTVFILVFYSNQRDRVRENKQMTANRLKSLFDEELHNSVQKMGTTLDVLVRSPFFTQDLKNQAINNLYERANPLFQNLKEKYQISHFYFHTPDRVTLLRLHSQIRGDLNNRRTILEAEETGKPAAGLEQGITGNPVLRMVYPWHLDYPQLEVGDLFDPPSSSPLIGYVELGVELQDIVKRTRQILRVDLVVVVNKQNLDREKWEERMKQLNRPSNWDTLPELLITEQTIKTIPGDLLNFLSHPIDVNKDLEIYQNHQILQAILIPLIDINGENLGYVIALKDINYIIGSARKSVLVVCLICLLVGASLVLFFYQFLGKIEEQLEERTNNLAKAKDLLEDSNQALQQSFQELQDVQIQLVQSEKMSTVGQLVAGIAHEINNPISFISGNLNYIEESLENLLHLLEFYQHKVPETDLEIAQAREEADIDYLLEDLPNLIHSMKEGVKRITDLSTSMRTFSRADTDQKILFNIHDGIDSTLMILKHRLKANENRPDILVIKHYSNLPLVQCYPGQLNQVFMNLIANAIDAFDEHSLTQTDAEIQSHPNQIIITTDLIPSQSLNPHISTDLEGSQASSVRIRIQDNGPGISDTVKNRIFEYLFTTKSVGKGTGLGLSISHKIITEKHQGQLICESELGQGATFIILIPIT